MLVLLFFDIFIPQIFFLVAYNDFHKDWNFLIFILVSPELFGTDGTNNKHPVKCF